MGGGGWPRLAGTIADLSPFLCVVPMMPKTSSVLPHSAPCSPFEVAHFHPQNNGPMMPCLDHVWFSDKAHFLLSGYVNSKNNVYWGTAPPQDVLQRPLH